MVGDDRHRGAVAPQELLKAPGCLGGSGVASDEHWTTVAGHQLGRHGMAESAATGHVNDNPVANDKVPEWLAHRTADPQAERVGHG